MATSIFTISPTAGTGSSQIQITPRYANNNSYDWTATGTISAGTSGVNFTITQFGVPAITQFGGSSNVPATGGTLMYTIYSHYPVVFRSVPDWVSIRDNHSNTYQEGQQIPSANTVNTTFYIDVAANTGSSRAVGSTFNLGHYLRGSLAQRVDYIEINQAGYTPGGVHTITSPSRLEIGKEGGSAKIIVTSDDYWYFYAVPNYITVYDSTWQQISSTSRHEGTGAEEVYYWTWPEYNGNEDRDATAIMMWGPNMELVTGPTFTQHPYTVLPYVQGNSSYNVPATGGTVYTYVDSNLPWWWYQNKQVWDGTTNFPSWITVRDANGNIMSGLTSQRKNTFKGGAMYSFTFAANTGTSRNFTPAIYYDRDSNTVSSATQSYAFVQAGAVGNTIAIEPNYAVIEFPYDVQYGDTSIDSFYITSDSDWSTSYLSYDGPYTLISPSTGHSGTTEVRFVWNDYPQGDWEQELLWGGTEIQVANANDSITIYPVKCKYPIVWDDGQHDFTTSSITKYVNSQQQNFSIQYCFTNQYVEFQFYAYGSWDIEITPEWVPFEHHETSGSYYTTGSLTGYVGNLPIESGVPNAASENDGYVTFTLPANHSGNERRYVIHSYIHPTTDLDGHPSGPSYTIIQSA